MKNNFDIDNFINSLQKACTKVQIKNFQKGEVITTYLLNRRQVCILISGSADLIRYDFNGTKTIVEKFYEKDVFGEIFYQINTNNDLFVLAKENSKVLFFNYDIFEKKCKKNCQFHEELLIDLPNLILSKIEDLNFRIELLSKRTIREKLISYFSKRSENAFNKTFSLSLTLTDLADYLSVDRSAMMREISNLKEDGFIRKDGHKITMLSD